MVKIATQVWKSETFTLQDGTTEIEIKPLNIKNLREFMKVISKLGEGESVEEREDNTINVIFDAAIIAIAKGNPELAKDREKLEDILDVPTIHKILEVAGGVKLNDPNLMMTE